MNKSELAVVIATKLDNRYTKQEVAELLTVMIDSIKEAVSNQQKVALKGFLTFHPVKREAQKGIAFGVEWSKPKSLSLKVKISTAFKKLLATKEV